MTKIHTLLIREEDKLFFEAIKNGIKTTETRAATEKYRTIKEGDVLDFVCGKEHLKKGVRSVKLFKTIEQVVEELEIKPIMPFVNSTEEMKKVYYSFLNYKEKIEKFGLIAFELE